MAGARRRLNNVAWGWRSFVLFALFVPSPGCSSGGGMDAQDFPSAFVKAGCRRAQDCCNWGPSSTTTPDAETRCEATADFSAALMGDLGEAVAERRATFDAI
ncbi:MAG TPA: hypothetical protein VNO55_22960, partial [Polyangia bacterium]|nr:hypothetical protein [Polyangia bacterium]